MATNKISALYNALVICILTLAACSSSPNPNTTSISFENNSEVQILIGKATVIDAFIQPYESMGADVNFHCENEDIAYVRETEVLHGNGVKYISVYINGVSVGETNIYAQTNDGLIQSEKVKILVTEDNLIKDTSTRVYLNLSGNHYHSSSECAGKSSYESTLNKAIKLKREACNKCVN